MDLTNLSLTELKALVYDNIVAIETAQANIKLINEEIQKRPYVGGDVLADKE